MFLQLNQIVTQTEGKSPYNAATAGSMTDLSSLYSSPSMPNISLGRPPAVTATQDGQQRLMTSSSQEGQRLAPVSEAEVVIKKIFVIYSLAVR
ncbi:hypothetical protein LSTR_LSTR015480 [Laodelphax striatellus]|uniref:Uncharacterized protein n=1 Tax=Laodelphax striatellus TaxID=195883 RepID=A0A482XB13_LAOST|nr:hypothetical protein LSTR_LSTR015480 [Laodelphax striatellus]